MDTVHRPPFAREGIFRLKCCLTVVSMKLWANRPDFPVPTDRIRFLP